MITRRQTRPGDLLFSRRSEMNGLMGRVVSLREDDVIIELFYLDGVTPFIVIGEGEVTLGNEDGKYVHVMTSRGVTGFVLRSNLSFKQNQFKSDSLNRAKRSRRIHRRSQRLVQVR